MLDRALDTISRRVVSSMNKTILNLSNAWSLSIIILGAQAVRKATRSAFIAHLALSRPHVSVFSANQHDSMAQVVPGRGPLDSLEYLHNQQTYAHSYNTNTIELVLLLSDYISTGLSVVNGNGSHAKFPLQIPTTQELPCRTTKSDPLMSR